MQRELTWLIILDRIAYIEFKTEAIAEKMLEETQGSDVQGRSIMVDFTGAKSRQSGKGPGEFNLLTQVMHFF